jgi:benzoyl-CoA reductase/2-hydroxyglutaryl-CoA dehydratase subunit BcrC/BadD/HgdB
MIEMDAWAVAAALLLKLDSSLHYSELTDRVISTRLSGLGYKGGQTPKATLRAIMADKVIGTEKVFRRVRRGEYAVNNPAKVKETPEVKAALAELQKFDQWGNRMGGEETIESLKERIQELEQRNELLEDIIRELKRKPGRA